jgi:hypothetical protein
MLCISPNILSFGVTIWTMERVIKLAETRNADQIHVRSDDTMENSLQFSVFYFNITQFISPAHYSELRVCENLEVDCYFFEVIKKSCLSINIERWLSYCMTQCCVLWRQTPRSAKMRHFHAEPEKDPVGKNKFWHVTLPRTRPTCSCLTPDDWFEKF